MSTELPYAGTSGHAGSGASKERAEREDGNGTTSKRQEETLVCVKARGYLGLTVKELREATGWHHGQASSALSILHKAGFLARLVEQRDRCGIYVLPGYVAGRDTQPHKANSEGRKQAPPQIVEKIVEVFVPTYEDREVTVEVPVPTPVRMTEHEAALVDRLEQVIQRNKERSSETGTLSPISLVSTTAEALLNLLRRSTYDPKEI